MIKSNVFILLIVVPTAAYGLLLKLRKLHNRENSCWDVGAVERCWPGMGNALGALPGGSRKALEFLFRSAFGACSSLPSQDNIYP